MPRFSRFAPAAVVSAIVLSTTTLLAIKYGELDAGRHPHVGLMVAQNATGDPLWRCSGTLLSPTVFLTAGHCTYGAAYVQVWFGDDLRDAAANNYPYVGEAAGVPYTHPAYNPAAFVLADVGVVVLSAPVQRSVYGRLPGENVLDGLATRRGKQATDFTAVGYGLQMSFPDAASFQEHNVRVRYLARPHLVQINTPGFTGSFSMLLSNNANTGGTCFGDSGGPNFVGDSNVVGGVTSFGINQTCTGTGGVFRLDRAAARDWVQTFLD